MRAGLRLLPPEHRSPRTSNTARCVRGLSKIFLDKRFYAASTRHHAECQRIYRCGKLFPRVSLGHTGSHPLTPAVMTGSMVWAWGPSQRQGAGPKGAGEGVCPRGCLCSGCAHAPSFCSTDCPWSVLLPAVPRTLLGRGNCAPTPTGQ